MMKGTHKQIGYGYMFLAILFSSTCFLTKRATSQETEGFDYVNVKDFGAVGDGETDDTEAIQEAVNSVGRGTVYVPQGTYVITSPIKLSYRRSLIGEPANKGFGGSVLKAGADMDSMITTDGWGHNMRIESLTLDGSADRGYSVDRGLELTFFTGSRVGNVKITNLRGTGIYFSGYDGRPAWIGWFEGLDIDIVGDDHFAIRAKGTDSYFKHIRVSGGKGIRDEFSGGNLYQNVVVKNSHASGFQLAKLQGGGTGISIVDSIFMNNQGHGINIYAKDRPLGHPKVDQQYSNAISVMGCVFEGNDTSDVILRGGRSVSLMNNDFKSTDTSSGHNVYSTNSPIDANYNDVMKNRFAASGADRVDLGGSDSTVKHNTFGVSDFSGSDAGLKTIIDPRWLEKIYDVQSEKRDQVVYNVKKRGARGNGSSDDTEAIQEAINNIPPGGVVYFPGGDYKITSTLVLKSNITLLGEGRHGDVTSFHLSEDLTYFLKTNKPTSNVLISRFNPGGSMDLQHLSHSVIDRVRGGAIHLGSDSSNVVIKGSQGVGPVLRGKNHILQSLYIRNATIEGEGGGHKIQNTHTDLSDDVAFLFTDPRRSSMDTLVRNSYFDLNEGDVFRFDFDKPQAANVKIQSVCFRNNGKEFSLRNTHHVTIEGAMSYNYEADPFRIEGDVKNIRFLGSRFAKYTIPSSFR